MEEKKKFLWIAVIALVFLAIIFGVAMILYSPSRSNGQNLKQATVITPATMNGTRDTATQSNIDPDSWVRKPGNTPGLDTSLKPTSGDINLTIVNGDNAGANYGTMDVSGLTDSNASKSPATTSGTATDPNASAQTLPLSAIPGQSGNVTVVNAGSAAAPVVVSQTTKQTSVTSNVQSNAKLTTTSTVKENPAVKQAAVKETPKKTAAVNEYWIQTGSFSSKLNAEKARETLTARYLKAEIFTKDSSSATTYRVRVGPYKSKSEADYWLGTVKEIPDFKGSYVSEVKNKK